LTLAYARAGTTALRNGSPIQRCFRDIHAATQHFLVDETTLIGYTRQVLDARAAGGSDA
jgi:Acyl-CoA dehydrogenase, C-terminal domain